jgi:hypothetical protein
MSRRRIRSLAGVLGAAPDAALFSEAWNAHVRHGGGLAQQAVW